MEQWHLRAYKETVRWGSSVFCGDYLCGRVKSVKPIDSERTVYNISVEEDESYIADGIVVHNCGHFHTMLELEYGFSNGSVAGVSEYARDGRMTPSQPQQWLLFCHPDWGVTARWPIMLEQRPRAITRAGDFSEFK